MTRIGTVRTAVCLLLVALSATPAAAHESRPAYLEITEQDAGRFDIIWKVPRRGERVLPLRIVLPENCTDLAPPAGTSSPEPPSCAAPSTAAQAGCKDKRSRSTDSPDP